MKTNGCDQDLLLFLLSVFTQPGVNTLKHVCVLDTVEVAGDAGNIDSMWQRNNILFAAVDVLLESFVDDRPLHNIIPDMAALN